MLLGIVHGDIKQENVLLNRVGRVRAQIIDFGLSAIKSGTSFRSPPQPSTKFSGTLFFFVLLLTC